MHSWHEYQDVASSKEIGYVLNFSNEGGRVSRTDLNMADQEIISQFEEACVGTDIDICIANIERTAVSHRIDEQEYYGYGSSYHYGYRRGYFCDDEEEEEKEWEEPEVTFKLSGICSLDGRGPFQNMQLEFNEPDIQLLGNGYGIFDEEPDDIEEDTDVKTESHYKSVGNRCSQLNDLGLTI